MKKLYILLLVAFSGYSQDFNYPGTYFCTTSPNVMPIFSPDTNTGGTFTSNPGLSINPVTGAINPGASTPGAYIVTYTVPAGPPDFITYTITRTIIITQPTVPVFDPIPTFCYGSNFLPVLPSVSNNGISGVWTSVVTNVMNTITVNYEFTPNNNQCAVPVIMSITVVQPVSGFITTETGSNTVYVDGNNAIVLPLTLSNEITSDEYTYQWFENGAYISDATSGTYTVNSASTNGEDRVYTVEMRNAISECSSMSNEFIVHQSTGTPPPFADRNQSFSSGSTLADIVVSGADVRWYASANGKNNNIIMSTPLPLNTILVDNTTYYASQTVNGNESVERNPVTVHLLLGIGENELKTVSYFPNPVKNSLTIKALDIIDSISIVNQLGQILKTTSHNGSEIVEDLSKFSAGTYFISISSLGRKQFFKIIKQ